MLTPKVFVIGCGIAGPVLAVFLKLKGYEPVLFDRLERLTEGGISFMLQPNGLKVLGLIPGFLERIPGRRTERFSFYSASSNQLLAHTDFLELLEPKYGYGMIGVPRPAFHRALVQMAEEQGIEIHWNHQLEFLEQGADYVAATFKKSSGGHCTLKASFIIGCDGLHSNTRTALFGAEKPNFTGLVQTSGVSPTPSVLSAKAALTTIFGIGESMITYNITDTHSAWSFTSPESEAKESWRTIDERAIANYKSGHHSEWPFGAGELVKNAEKISRYGLYDRPALKTWHSGRVVLLGDAAHPTTPHLGQGANQAFEDVYHLIRVLQKHHPDPTGPLSTDMLGHVFAEYESVRITRTAALVLAASARGEMRVLADPDAVRARNEAVRNGNRDPQVVMQEFSSVLSGPFEGESEVTLV